MRPGRCAAKLVLAYLFWMNLRALHSRIVLVVFAAIALLFAAVTLSPLKSGFADAPPRGPGDVELYRAEVDRIQNGEGYYSAIATVIFALANL